MVKETLSELTNRGILAAEVLRSNRIVWQLIREIGVMDRSRSGDLNNIELTAHPDRGTSEQSDHCEGLEVVVLGDAVEETKQASQWPLFIDSIFGLGLRD